MNNERQDGRPLLTLAMIVKDEARGIRETLESTLPAIDRYALLDTGSTDGTQDIIRAVMSNVPGDLVEEPFIDFSTSRNRALEIAGTQTVFTLMLSGDEILRNPTALRAFCEEYRDHDAGAYDVRIRFGDSSYASPRLTRTDAAWRYVGVTHEVLYKQGAPAPSVEVPNVDIFHDRSTPDHEAQRRRWRRDKELLLGQRAALPDDTRTVFYLAQTHECLGEWDAALKGYRDRVAMGGWDEEVYESLYRIGRVLDRMGEPWPLAQNAYLEAHAHSPQRAEPLYAIAAHWYALQNWPLTFLFASRAAAIPRPSRSRLFVSDPVYDFQAADLVGISGYYVGEYQAGEAACRRLLEQNPSDERIRRNLGFYLDRKKSPLKDSA